MIARVESVESIVDEWGQLAISAARPTVFLTWEWLGSWLAAYRARTEHFVLAVRSHGELVGIAPFYVDLTRPRSLRLIGDGTYDSDNLGFLAKEGCLAGVTACVLQWLAHCRNGWTILKLNAVPSEEADVIRSELQVQRWKVIAADFPHPVISLPATWEAYLSMLSPNMRSSINRKLKKFEQENIRLTRCDDIGDLDGFLSALFNIHDKHWRARNQKGAFSLPGRKDFFRRVATRSSQKGWLDFWALEIGGSAVALEFGFTYAGTYSFLQSGFDPAFEQSGPGVALKALVIRELIARGVRFYDFLGGGEEYKYRWGAEHRTLVNMTCAPPGSPGAAYLYLRSAVASGKARLRAHAPGLFSLLKRCFRVFRHA